MERYEMLLKESEDPDRRLRLQGREPEKEREEKEKKSLLEHPQVKPIIEALKKIPEYTALGLACLRTHPKYVEARRKGFPLFLLILAAFSVLAVIDFALARRFVILPMSIALLALAYLSGIGIFVTYFTILQAYLALKPEKIKEKLAEGKSYEDLLQERIRKGFIIRYYGFLILIEALIGLISLARHLKPPIYPLLPGFLHGSLRSIYASVFISIRLIAAGTFLLFVYVVPAILGQVRPFAYRETLKERLGMRISERKRGVSRRRKKVRKRRIELLQEEVNDLKTSLILARFRMAVDYLPYLGLSAIFFPPSALASTKIKRRLLYDPYPLDELERGLLVFIPVSIFVILVLTTPLGVRRIFLSPLFNFGYGLGVLKGVKIFEEIVERIQPKENEESRSRAHRSLYATSRVFSSSSLRSLEIRRKAWNRQCGSRTRIRSIYSRPAGSDFRSHGLCYP